MCVLWAYVVFTQSCFSLCDVVLVPCVLWLMRDEASIALVWHRQSNGHRHVILNWRVYGVVLHAAGAALAHCITQDVAIASCMPKTARL